MASRRIRADDPLEPAERLACDAVGQLMQFWGFKRAMGRMWTLLYLSDRPLGAREIGRRLGMSSGAVSMTSRELLRWGVIHRVWVHGARGDHFVAEVNLWKMISRVLGERERAQIVEAIAALEAALSDADRRAKDARPEHRARGRLQRERIGALLDLAHLGRRLLDVLVRSGRVDATALSRALLVRRTDR
ncbi:MAG: ArsR family transcriptional regulator [Myxococcota bacterium]|nr:ArsR family transcriptional regulator [Myxococcota bacterium]MDW8361181.1 ArsR family transcriptional regulator [Myxococcales bacterium]